MRSAYFLSVLICLAFLHTEASAAKAQESFLCKSTVADQEIEVILKRFPQGRIEISKGSKNFKLVVLQNEASMFSHKDLTLSFSADCCHTKTEDYCVGYGVNLIPYNEMRTVESVSKERRLRVIFSKGLKKMASKDQMAAMIHLQPVTLTGEILPFAVVTDTEKNRLYHNTSLRLDCYPQNQLNSLIPQKIKDQFKK